MAVGSRDRIRFGTDGVRGVANETLLPEDVLRLGYAYGRYLAAQGDRRPLVIGRDPRLSSTMFCSAFKAGVCSAGIDVLDSGVLSSPALAYLAGHLEVCAGAMISASHNPAHHNGVKLFDCHGQKLAAAAELEIEELANSPDQSPRADATEVGCVGHLTDPLSHYLDHLRASVSGVSLSGLKVVFDSANGAASGYGAQLIRELGATVIHCNHEPNGININTRCGATYPQGIRGAVLTNAADIGICVDGDADRVALVDEHGTVLDGDHIKWVWASHEHARGRLRNPTIVGTVMSNLGLEIALRQIGCGLVRTLVGDRYVYERMIEMGALVGGEPSGHIIFSDYARTGDGLLSALQVLRVMHETGAKLSQLAGTMRKTPQVLRNVPFDTGTEWRTPAIVRAIAEWEDRLGETGRIVVRESGTEPLLRVMCECTDPAIADRVVEDLLGLFAKHPGAVAAAQKARE